jgi:hypothetical protein
MGLERSQAQEKPTVQRDPQRLYLGAVARLGGGQFIFIQPENLIAPNIRPDLKMPRASDSGGREAAGQ